MTINVSAQKCAAKCTKIVQFVVEFCSVQKTGLWLLVFIQTELQK